MSALPAGQSSRLVDNVMHFARVLRAAGVPVGSDRIILSLQALEVAGLERRDDLHATLAACMVDRAEHRALFDQAFHLFWRDPDLLGRAMAMLLPRVQGRQMPPLPNNRRLADALFPARAPEPGARREPEKEKIELDAALTWSDRELLQKADFETMPAEEWQEAKLAVQRMGAWVALMRTRRWRQSARARQVDWRATLRASARGADAGALRWKEPRVRPMPLVVIADISGSMSRYARMLLHFTHALANSPAAGGRRGPPHVDSFVFGTRLTPITRALKQRDPDLAVAAVVRAVDDWSGGTRIGDCLHRFNQDWSRRVLSQNATVLLVTDGLERTDDDQGLALLERETERLARSCRHLIWLNPLLRYEGFEPRAAGIRAMLPFVDRMVAAHNLQSLGQLAALLARPGHEHERT